ncbi:hypothetical protein [Carboxylicivirga sp. M1479]|uniref:hypothetical protein n=1 Tax=Carboxylicivirga sp. M1479 TaxID=2594476 RepID=UPI001177AE58|nr:hypothetical protein [Carboxylicivirga sp. M1479]TRX70591.1 hypothetical protein FNN09_11485 [Carboxylicivirga sp. M1479]
MSKDNQHKKVRSTTKIMRALHRDIGFLMIGLTIIYCISGIVLVYRDTDTFTIDEQYIENIKPNMAAHELGSALKLRRLRVLEETADTIYFNYGNYCKSSGEAVYTINTYPDVVWLINGFHKTKSRFGAHWLAVIYGVLLFFLAISSLWMYKPKSKKFIRGLVLTAIGLIIAVIALYI